MGGSTSNGLTIVRRLEQLADTCGDQLFLEFADGTDDVSWTYSEFEKQVNQFAAFLSRLGVRKGDMVHLQLGNCPEFLISFFGAVRLGAVVVPVNPSASYDDVAYVISHAECSLSIIESSCAEIVLSALDLSPDIRQVICFGPRVLGTIDFEDYKSSPATRVEPLYQVNDSDLVAILYTSGTTGWPKGVMITHRNLLFVGDAVSGYLRIRPSDRWLVSLPLFHINALGYSAMSVLSSGSSMTLMPEFSTEAWIRQVSSSAVTLSSLFAVHCRQLLSAEDGDSSECLKSLRTIVFAQNLQGSERSELTRRFGAATLQIYGMTETVAPVIGDPPYGEFVPSTMGRTLFWSQTKIVDHNGHDLGPGVAGELLVRGTPGDTLMKGYHQRPDETALTIQDGWLRTGDKVVQQLDGRYQFLGRAREIIKPGVYNVSAPEVERVLVEHVSVVDASVIGSRSPTGDEQIIAFVELHDGHDATPAEILEWAQHRLADYKRPHRLLILERLPRNAVGKVLKRDLQRLAGN